MHALHAWLVGQLGMSLLRSEEYLNLVSEPVDRAAYTHLLQMIGLETTVEGQGWSTGVTFSVDWVTRLVRKPPIHPLHMLTATDSSWRMACHGDLGPPARVALVVR